MDATNTGYLSTSAEASESFFQTIYDRGSSKLAIERVGIFWQAAQVASDLGLRGRGRRIAIIDAGFDMNVESLAAAAASTSCTTPKTVRKYGHHGTNVALLIHEVASEAELVLIDIDPITEDSVSAALERARDVQADVVNLSLEFKSDCPVARKPGFDYSVIVSTDPDVESFLQNLDIWIEHLEVFAGGCRKECKICASIRSLPATMLLISAAGNRFRPACPASNDQCLGIGFEHQTVIDTADAALLVSSMPSGFTQSGLSELAIPQPAGFFGTSFASPLITALAAVIDDPQDLAVMARFQMAMAPITWAFHPVQQRGTATKSQIESIHRGFCRLIDEIPPHHRHWETNRSNAPCVVCSIFTQPWYRDFVAFLTSTGLLDWAVHLGSAGEAVAPYSAEVIGNYGVALRAMAECAQDTQHQQLLFKNAALRFKKASELQPQTRMYIEHATAIETTLRGLK